MSAAELIVRGSVGRQSLNGASDTMFVLMLLLTLFGRNAGLAIVSELRCSLSVEEEL